MNICFFVRHFTERGTEVAVYDYAKYNEELLNNNSIIICFNEIQQRKMGFPEIRTTFDKFKNRFEVIEINNINEINHIIEKRDISFFYTLTHGGSDIYNFNNKDIWGKCKTIKHCVFETLCPESDYYISIASSLNDKYNTKLQVIPHIVNLPDCNEDLRNILGIPKQSFVFGRYGGIDEFNIPFVYTAIINYLNLNENVYFLFMNTKIFYKHPQIIYLDKSIDLDYKVRFINSCDAMIHARVMGETFGLSIGEFSIKNKPIITCICGDLEHIRILGDKAIVYSSYETLMFILSNIKHIVNSRNDWKAYNDYSPSIVMQLFHNIFTTRNNFA